MIVKTLYRYTRPDGGQDVSPQVPAAGFEYVTTNRLIADAGRTLTDGTVTADVVDTDTPEAWQEIEGDDDITAEEALEIIMGGGDET